MPADRSHMSYEERLAAARAREAKRVPRAPRTEAEPSEEPPSINGAAYRAHLIAIGKLVPQPDYDQAAFYNIAGEPVLRIDGEPVTDWFPEFAAWLSRNYGAA